MPSTLTIGLIVPVIKKPSLDPNSPSSYRPITLSSTHAKLVELIMLPKDSASPSQFGFRTGRGTTHATSLLNDVIYYFKDGGSPVYICSLDAEKCFDKLWHDALMYKLWGVLEIPYWILLYKWYRKLQASVRWNNDISSVFNVSRGTRQGSILSPTIFNIFIDDLLKGLAQSECGIRIGRFRCNSFAYADDITLMSATVTGLQSLISYCAAYSQKWRFNYNITKSKCMTSGPKLLKEDPVFYLNNHPLENVESLEILGCSFTSQSKASTHVDKRIQKGRQSFFSLLDAGMGYPGVFFLGSINHQCSWL